MTTTNSLDNLIYGYRVVIADGVEAVARSTIRFLSGITVADNPGLGTTDVTVPAGAAGSNGAAGADGNAALGAVTVTGPTTGQPPVVTTVYHSLDDAVLTDAFITLTGNLVGAGSVSVRVGLSSGADDGILLATSFDSSSTTGGDPIGLLTAQLGAALASNKNYRCYVSNADYVQVTLTVTGVVTQAPTFVVSAFGCRIPLS